MEAIKQYILSIVSICICCGIFRKISGEKRGSAFIINTICGIIIAIAVISPVIKINIQRIEDYWGTIDADGQMYVQSAVNSSDQELRKIIINRLRAYILEKASSYDCAITEVSVCLSSEDVPVPESLEIIGRYSPYSKNQLAELFESNLGILKERQTWIYQS